MNDIYSTEKIRKLAIFALAFSFFFIAISMSLFTAGYVFAVVCSLFMMGDQQYRNAIMQNPITYWLLAFYALFLFGACYSVGTGKQILHDLYQHSWIITTIPLLSLFCNPKMRFVLLYALLAGMAFVMCLSYLGYFGFINSQEGLGLLLKAHFYNYNTAVFTRHITQNFLMAFAAAIWLYLIYFEKSKHNWYRIVLFVLSTVNVLFVSTGRTGYLIFTILVFTLSYYRFGLKKVWLVVVALTLLLSMAFLFSTNFATRIKAIQTNYQDYKNGMTQSDIGYRVGMVVNDISLIKKHPILGFGTGGFGRAYETLDKKFIDATGAQETASEITYLNIFVELGAIGFGFMLTFFIFLWRYSFRIDEEGKIIFQAFLFSFLAGGLFTPFLSHTFARYMFSIVLAMMFAHLPSHAKTGKVEISR